MTKISSLLQTNVKSKISLKEPETAIYYFSFGSNMSAEVINKHREVKTLSSAAAVLKEYKLVFNSRGLPIIEPSFANISPAKNDSVWGVVYELNKSEWHKIIATEGKDYEEHKVEIETVDSKIIKAVTLYATKNLVENGKPSKRYLSIIVGAAIERNLPEYYLDYLNGVETTHIPVVSNLFTLAINLVIKPVLFRIYRITRRDKRSNL